MKSPFYILDIVIVLSRVSRMTKGVPATMSSKKEMLLNVSEHLFYLHGFHAIGLKRIITDADVAIMTLYNHFASKDDLIVEVLLRREQRYLEQLRLYADNKAQSIFLNLAEGHAKWLMEHESRGCLFLRAKEEFGADPDHVVVQTVNAHKKHVMTLIKKVIPKQLTGVSCNLCCCWRVPRRWPKRKMYKTCAGN